MLLWMVGEERWKWEQQMCDCRRFDLMGETVISLHRAKEQGGRLNFTFIGFILIIVIYTVATILDDSGLF